MTPTVAKRQATVVQRLNCSVNGLISRSAGRAIQRFLADFFGNEVDKKQLLKIARANRSGTDQNEGLWKSLPMPMLQEITRNESARESSKRSATWKLELASKLKRETSVSNAWSVPPPQLGHPQAASAHIIKWLNLSKYEA
jgi:hypothetical protein